MRIAIITWLSYPNYGTVLQAYALQQALEQLGHSTALLSDREVLQAFRKEHPYPKELVEADRRSNAASPTSLRELVLHPRRLLRSVKARLDPKGYGKPCESSQQAVLEFMNGELAVDYDVTPKDLSSLNDRYDVFVCGSDQIWSVLPVNYNPYYFLDFVKKPKLSYAPSLGTDRIPPETGAEISRLLKDFSAVSVRESRSAEQLSELLRREVAWVADPTLLHDRSFWTAFASGVAPIRGRYLLCYFLESRQWYFDRAEALAKALHLKMILLPSRWEHLIRGCVETKTVGPREFVAYFRDAACVLTDSYHGSIFSLLFEKDFQYLQRFRTDDPGSQNIRVTSLFDRLGLQDRIVTQDGGEMPPYNIPEYDQIRQKTAQFRISSRQYLETSLDSLTHTASD